MDEMNIDSHPVQLWCSHWI